MKSKRHLSGPVASALSNSFSGKDPERIVRALAHHLYSSVALSGPPFSPFQYAEALGLRIERANIEADGQLAGWPGKECRVVLREKFLGRDKPDGRENFTLAHEIGHYLIRESLEGFVPQSIFMKEHPDEERLCNIFAEELLMPSFRIFRDVGDRQLTPKQIMLLAAKYEVSLTALLQRVARGIETPFFAAIWKLNQGHYETSWATPARYCQLILCDTGNTTVERAYKLDEEVSGRDHLLLNTKRMVWPCTSIRLSGHRVLTVGSRSPKGKIKASEQEQMPVMRLRRGIRTKKPVQLSLPLCA